MKILRFALGVRFEAGGREEDPSFAKACIGALLGALAPKELEGLLLYGGTDAVTAPGNPAYIAVIMGGSLKRTRRLYERLKAGLGALLCRERPFIESNRVAHLEGLAYYGQAQGNGCFSGGAPLPG